VRLLIGYTLALAIGLSLGLLGGGGSILTVPIFVFVMGYDPKLAVAMSLPVVGLTSLAGAASHWRSHAVNLRVAVTFGVVAMLGALLAARVAARIPGIVQLTLLGLVMFVAAAFMLRPIRDLGSSESESLPRHRLLVAATGLGVGVLTGLVGIGGGFLFVPALVLLAGLPMKNAVGTSLLVIAMNTAAGSVGYHGQVEVPWNVVAAFSAIAIVGSVVGAIVIRGVSQPVLRKAFGYFLLAMAAFILYQNRAVIRHPLAALHPSSSSSP
jgi:uncharacterized membrane protein YfcA